MRVATAGGVGEDRFQLGEILGSGGMGVVYRAHDRRLGHDVALKLLRNASARDLYRFKREFRTLADLVHPNLVALHELHTAGDEWFFTMELIDGVPFIDRVRPPPVAPRPEPARPPRAGEYSQDATGPRAPTSGPRHRRDIVAAPLDRARLDAALPQLVDGIMALHLSGKLHRDLKPSNVLVTPAGRVVLLDFGLVADVDASHAERTHEQAAVGTPVYMSPEQAADQPLTEASDWYAVGVMLYEALTGQRPFEGDTTEVLQRKQADAPAPPRDLAPDAPAELSALCLALLARDPAARPDGRAVLRALGREPSPATLALEGAVAQRPFVGRGEELDLLRRALQASRHRATAVFVGGESGIGKTQLVRRFLDEIGDRALILEGRCYERESVPFKALDTVIDALTSALLQLADDRVRAGVPTDIASLARLFPVLRRVPAVAERAVVGQLPAAPHELRRRASSALRALLGWLAAARPLVVAIDDLQWGDADSAGFLADLIHHPDARPLLLVMTHRLEDDAGVVRRVREPASGMAGGDVRTIELGPLPPAEARRLIQSYGGSDITADDLARDAGGHPLFLVELARTANKTATAPASLDDLIAARLATLPAAAAAVLRVAAVAARPLSVATAARATGLAAVPAELPLLRTERLLRIRRLGDDDAAFLEPYHDRVRAAVVAAMTDDERRAVHRSLARAYEDGADVGDLEAVVGHWLDAGEPARAASYAVRAAEAAAAALAFHSAAELYALALAHDDGGDADAQRALRRRRGEALADAGRLEEAAFEFATAADGATAAEALELDRLSLEQLLRRGLLTEGLALSRQVLARIGVVLPTTRAGAIRAVVGQRIRLRLRGLKFTERAEATIDPAVLQRVDVLQSVSTGLSLVDPTTGLLVQCHALRAALDAGEPRRAATSLAIELGYLGQGGTRNARRIDRVGRQVHALAERVGDRSVLGLTIAMQGLSSLQQGRFRDARTLLESGLKILREHGVGVRWTIDTIENFLLTTMVQMGEWREVARRVPVLLRDAIERGDIYAQHALRGRRTNTAWLVGDHPDEARAQLAMVETRPATAADFQLRHFYELISHVQIDLYIGDAAAATRRLEAAWPMLVGSYLLRVQSLRVEAMFTRGRVLAAQALAASPREQRHAAGQLRTISRGLAREGATYAAAYAAQLAALAALLAGNLPDAIIQLDIAARGFAACDMALFATVARLRHADLDRGTIGAARAAAARDSLRDQAIVAPESVARALCPWPA